MGVYPSKHSDDVAKATPADANPNPHNFKIISFNTMQNGEDRYTVVMIEYPDCTTYDGLKVLVYKNIFDLMERKKIDPHFLGTDTSPIARFPGDKQGLEHALFFIMGIIAAEQAES